MCIFYPGIFKNMFSTKKLMCMFLLLFVTTLKTSTADLMPSPCPDVLKYVSEEKYSGNDVSNPEDYLSMHLNVTLIEEEQQREGTMIMLRFKDKPYDVKSDLGKIFIQYDTTYYFLSRKLKLKVNVPETIGVDVIYNRNDPKPEVTTVAYFLTTICEK